MKMITRRGLMRGAAGGASLATLGLADKADAATALDASFTPPYPTKLSIPHPSSWFVYTALIPTVVEPFDVFVSSRPLGPFPSINGRPDLRVAPTDATMVFLYLHPPVPEDTVTISTASAVRLTSTMSFSDLGGGFVNWQGFRNFLGWYIATSEGQLYSIGINVFVGQSAGPEWTTAKAIVDGIQSLL